MSTTTLSTLVSQISKLRESSPLVHNITNYVVMNNTANALLAIGASPVMAHSTEEVEQMVGIASSLVINIGTLEPSWVEAMILAGKKAKERGIPVILDPVGVGATSYRNEVCAQIIEECRPDIIRGNGSEIMALVNTSITTKGVDSSASSSSALDYAKTLAKNTGAIVVISGEIDYITDGEQVRENSYGATIMASVTGMGCTASAIVGAFAAIESDYLKAATEAMQAMGVAGQIAASYSKGSGSMQVNFLDEMYNLGSESIQRL